MVAERTGSTQTLAEGSEESVVPDPGDPRLRRKRIFLIAGVALAALTFDFIFAERHGFFDLHVYHGAINYWVHRVVRSMTSYCPSVRTASPTRRLPPW